MQMGMKWGSGLFIFICTFKIYRYFREFSVLYHMFSLCCLYSCFGSCNAVLFVCKDHYENKVVKPVLCQYHLVTVFFIFYCIFYFLFLSFCMAHFFVTFSLLDECIIFLFCGEIILTYLLTWWRLKDNNFVLVALNVTNHLSPHSVIVRKSSSWSATISSLSHS